MPEQPTGLRLLGADGVVATTATGQFDRPHHRDESDFARQLVLLERWADELTKDVAAKPGR